MGNMFTLPKQLKPLSFSPSAKKKQFEMMRKMHYNEGLSIRMARQLIANEQAEEEDEDEEMKEDMETEDFIVDPPHDGKANRHTQTLRR